MLLAHSAILPLISPGRNPFRKGIMDRATHIPGLTRTTHEAMASALSKATHGLLTPDRQMARLCRVHLLSTRLNQKRTRSLRLHQPVPPSMRPRVPPQLCRSPPCRVSHRSTRPLKCALLTRRLPRVSLPMTSSQLRQALELNLCPTISRHPSVTVSRHHHTQLRRYVRQKSPPSMTTRSVVANRRKLSSQKALRLPHLSRSKELFESLPLCRLRNPSKSSHGPLTRKFRLFPSLLKSQSQLLPHRS